MKPDETLANAKRRYMRSRVFRWYRTNSRSFPWRMTSDPYKVLVAEILLQQTDALKVGREYVRFIRLYPSVRKLAEASLRDLRTFTRRLGLDYRARRLREIAREVEEKFAGRIPNSEADLVSLHGVGKYIANAVLACAYGRRAAVLDTNIVRVIERFFGVTSDRARARTDPDFWLMAQEMLPKRAKACRSWTYALLDFAALVCTHYHPKCTSCPCRRKCAHFLGSRA